MSKTRVRVQRWLEDEWKTDLANAALLALALFVIWLTSGRLAG
jgi:hypothetical protein